MQGIATADAVALKYAHGLVSSVSEAAGSKADADTRFGESCEPRTIGLMGSYRLEVGEAGRVTAMCAYDSLTRFGGDDMLKTLGNA